MKKNIIKRKYDVVVVGGGMSGVCAAISSARHGAKTALINNRPVLGGNASSEIRMHICGADAHGARKNARETGILEEILLENRKKNPQLSYSAFDTVIWAKAKFQENLDLYQNTQFVNVNMNENEIESIEAEQLTTEKRFVFKSNVYIDATGDATLSYLAGATCMVGREGKEVYGETFAPDKSDSYTMGNSLLFTTKNMGEKVEFIKPSWANTYTEDDLKYRHHGATGENFWWIELGGTDLSTIDDAETLNTELLKAVYGVWDHIKNGGDHGADNYALDWVGHLAGKRESRRVLGDYILKESDLIEGKIFDDAIAYGGWSMDMHIMGGLNTKAEPTNHIVLDDVYTIPYRCIYSKDIGNLLVCGRAISTSHMAFGSTRVMGTCSVVGQAAGTAAALANEKGIKPREVQKYIGELQKNLIDDDLYIPGYKNNNNILSKSKVTASSCKGENYRCENVVNGYQRTIKNHENLWISDKLDDEEWIDFKLENPTLINKLSLRFDSNLSRQIMISEFDNGRAGQVPGIPCELVKDYRVEFYNNGKLVHFFEETDNYLRFRVYEMRKEVICDEIRVIVTETNGCENVRIFEVVAM